MKRREKARVYPNVVEWLASLPPRKRSSLRKAANSAEKLRKASHG